MPPFPIVAHQLEQLQSRRAAQAQVRRRRRRAGVLAMVAIAVVVVAVVLITGSGSSSKHTSASAQTVASAKAPHARHVVAAGARLRAEYAAVQRLAGYGLPLYCAGRSKRMVALTFDDGPGPYTTLALKKLRAAHLNATFFLVGKSINAYPSLARLEKPVAAVGDHTLTHPFLPGLSQSGMQHEIADARPVIERAASQPVYLFRPPYGSRTAAIDAEARSLGMVEVLWTQDSADSLGANYAGIERNVIAGLHPGSIILMHENRGQTIRALPVIFAAIAREHFRAVTLPELIAQDPPTLAQLKAGVNGCGSGFHSGSGG